MSRTILLADDSVTIQKVIELTFMEEDYEVVAAGDGDEALERLEELRPDFVIADVHMPGASGIDVCRRSKQLHPEVPVLLLVGTFEPFDEGEARSAGADAHLKKPFDSQELLQLVDDLMGPEGETAAAPAAPAAEEAAEEPVEEGDDDSTWGFDLGDSEEAAGEPAAYAVALEEPAEASIDDEPAEEPSWAASADDSSDDEIADAGGGEAEWRPTEDRPAEVVPPAVGQVDVGEPVWERADSGEEPERAPFDLGAAEPRRPGADEVFDLGADEEPAPEPAEPEAEVTAESESAVSEEPDQGWGFGVQGGEAGAAPGTGDGAAEADDDHGGAAAGFRWDENDEPDSLVEPPADPEADESEAEVMAHEPEGAGEVEDEPVVEEPPSVHEEAYEEEEEEEALYAGDADVEEPLSVYEEEDEELYAGEPEAEEPPPEPVAVPGSGASYGGAEVSAAAAAGVDAAAAPLSGGLSEGDVERIARRVAELVGDRVTREVAWEVVPDLAEVVIRERLRELEGQID